MKNKIYGRKVGSKDGLSLLIEGTGVSTGGKTVDPGVTDEIAVASARRAVQVLRDKNVEGYIVFEGDPTHYDFTPGQDFAYPATIHYGKIQAVPTPATSW